MAPSRGRSRSGDGAAPGNGGGRPPFSRRLPRSGPRPPRPSGARGSPRKRTIAPRVRREAIDGERYSSDKSRRKRSGSRPINHGCSVRDSRPGSSSPTLRQLRSPFGGPWPTPRVAPGASLLDVHRTLRPTLHRGKTRVVPLRRRRWSVAREHHAGTLVPEHRGTIPVRSRDACNPAVPGGNPARSTSVRGGGARALQVPLKVPAEGPVARGPPQVGWLVARRRAARRGGGGCVTDAVDAGRTITARTSSNRRIAVRLVSMRSGNRCAI